MLATSFEDAVETYGLTVKEPAPFKAVDNLEGFGPYSSVASVAIETPPGQTAPPIEWRRSFIIVRVLSKSELDPTDFRARAEQIRDMIETQKIQTYTAFWYEKLKEESVIEDFRGKVY